MQPVQLPSKTLASALYHPRRRQLELEFHVAANATSIFRFPRSAITNFCKPTPKGTYFNRNIRNRFPFQDLSIPSGPVILASPKN